jgi:hypothetical protein
LKDHRLRHRFPAQCQPNASDTRHELDLLFARRPQLGVKREGAVEEQVVKQCEVSGLDLIGG